MSPPDVRALLVLAATAVIVVCLWVDVKGVRG